jgi:tetratricopeptide (TPR) repeat protein
VTSRVGAPLAAAALLLGACAHPRTAPAPPRATRLAVPFFPDRTDQCGPSALAGVLGFWGAAVGPARLKEAAYTARLKGSLPVDLLLAARERGMRAEMFDGTLERVREELDAGRPVVAFVNRGFRRFPIGHFLVLTGYDDGRREVYAHSGSVRDAPMPYKKFLSAWDKGGRWGLLVQPPGDPEGWVAFGNAAYGEGRLDEAEGAFRKALALAPRHPGAGNNLAMTLLARAGSPLEAERLARGALAVDGPLKPYILDTLAHVCLRQGRLGEAWVLAAQAEAAAPQDDLAMRAQLAATRGLIEAASRKTP